MDFQDSSETDRVKHNIRERSSGTSIDLTTAPSSPKNIKKKQQPSGLKSFLKRLLNNSIYTILMTLVTIYALFGDDIRMISTSKDTDSIFYTFTIICIVLFSIEIILSSFVQDNYLFKFFFWLDLIATVSLLADVGWIWDAIVGTSESLGKSTTQATQITRASRASRAGTRATRLIRVIRVLRLVRIVKLYKMTQIRNKRNSSAQTLLRGVQNYRGEEVGGFISEYEKRELDVEIEDEASHSFESIRSESVIRKKSKEEGNEINLDFSIPEESKIGKKFSDLTTKRVIILVLLMLLILPIFYSSFYLDNPVSYSYGLQVMFALRNTQDFSVAWDRYISEHQNISTPLIYLETTNGSFWSSGSDPYSLRSSELSIFTVQSLDFSILAIFDNRSRIYLDGIMSISKTLFICLVLAISTIFLTKDAQELVIEPIENMIEKVKKIAENPLKAAQEEEKKVLSLQLTNFDSGENKLNKEPLETVILQKTISKIGALLALGFGEAGSEIISMNMQRVGGEVDPMISGKKTYCIFGFCDIRNFSQTTEILQQNILSFVNEIALIVHKTVDYFSGFANKNIGECFLLVWKFPEKLIEKQEDGKVFLIEDRLVTQISDMAVISFIKIIIEIHSNEKILKYQQHPDLSAALPGYSVNMGFGMHQGWAIEGAIGSEFKIDASYLSPNVNMASRLEAATRQFGVEMLISDAMHSLLSKHMKNQFRKIDRVTVKGSQIPIDLYTCDLDLASLKPFHESENLDGPEASKVASHLARDQLMEKISSGALSAFSLFENDEQIISARKIPKKFFKYFDIAIQDYLKGLWLEAKAGFVKAQEVKGRPDGPCLALIQYMDEFELEPPSDWAGYRVLYDK